MHLYNNNGRSYAIIVLFMWILLCAYVAISLYLENRYYSMTGWIIVIFIFSFIAFLALVKEKIIVPKNENITSCSIHKYTNLDQDENDYLVLLISSKDTVKIHAVKHALTDNGIICTLTNQNLALIMQFLPSVETGIMVLKKDYENSLKILQNLNVEK